MEKTKKGFQIEFCANKEDSDYTTIGLTFALLSSSFSAIDGFPWYISIAFLLLAVILPIYDLGTKVADKRAETAEDTKAE